MLKYILFGLGFVLIFEGLVYFLFAGNLQKMLEVINSTETEKVRFFSGVLMVIGLCLIYFTFRFYGF